MKRIALFSAFTMALFLCNCLPGDIRPTPGQVVLTAEPAASMIEGLATEDGWNIVFDRFLVGIGGGELEGEACTQYANARYGRLFDFVVPGSQKVCELYGLGTCDIEVLVRPPQNDAILENGVKSDDLTFMRLPYESVPAPMEAFPFDRIGSSVFAHGQATRAGVTKRFEWKFASGMPLRDCGNIGDIGYTSAVVLHGGEKLRPVISIHGEELFRSRPEENAPLLFDTLANADEDGDGTITTAELLKFPAPVIETDGGIPDAGLGDGGAADQGSMAVYLGRTLLQRVVYLDDRPCKSQNFR